MHINDTYVLRSVLRMVRDGRAVERKTLNALIEAADDEVVQFEDMLETMAREHDPAYKPDFG